MCLPVLIDHPESLIEKGLYKNYEWVVLHNGSGYCGYIKLLPDHPWYGMKNAWQKDFYKIKVHGGITYGEFSKSYDQTERNNKFWLGFDCCHAGDIQNKNINSLMFVKKECFNLIDQAIAAI